MFLGTGIKAIIRVAVLKAAFYVGNNAGLEDEKTAKDICIYIYTNRRMRWVLPIWQRGFSHLLGYAYKHQ